MNQNTLSAIIVVSLCASGVGIMGLAFKYGHLAEHQAPEPIGLSPSVPVHYPDGTVHTWTAEGGAYFSGTELWCHGQGAGSILINGHDVCKEAQ